MSDDTPVYKADFCVPDAKDSEIAQLKAEIAQLDADCDARVTAAQVERDTFRKAVERLRGEQEAWRAWAWAAIGEPSGQCHTHETLRQAITSELDAMQHRAEAAESDWQAAEQREATLRQKIGALVEKWRAEVDGKRLGILMEAGMNYCADELSALLAPETPQEPPAKE